MSINTHYTNLNLGYLLDMKAQAKTLTITEKNMARRTESLIRLSATDKQKLRDLSAQYELSLSDTVAKLINSVQVNQENN